MVCLILPRSRYLNYVEQTGKQVNEYIFYNVMPSWNKLIMMKVTAVNIWRNKREDNIFFKHTCTDMLHEHAISYAYLKLFFERPLF